MPSPKVSGPRDEMIAQGQGLVRSIALKVYRSLPVPMDLDDLIAYGQLGLAEAARAYDPGQHTTTKFTTFAYYRVRGAIYDGVSKMTWTSRARLRRLRFEQMADDVLQDEAESGVAGDGDDVSDDVAWLGRVTEKLAVVYLASGPDDSISASLESAADPGESPSVRVASIELQTRLRTVVEDLPADAKRLIKTIYFEGCTLSQAAQRSGISKSWASRLHAKSLEQLAKIMRGAGGDG